MGTPADPSMSLPLLDSTRADASAASPLETEVAQFFDELRNPLFRYLLSLGLSVHDCEEVIQEIFLSLFQHLQRGKPRGNLRGWIFRVGHNLALKQRNRDMLNLQGHPGHAADHQLDPSPDPEEQVVSNQRQQRLQAVMRAMSQQDRSCLHLRAEGLRYREIAEVLGISLGGVALALERSLARLSRVPE